MIKKKLSQFLWNHQAAQYSKLIEKDINTPNAIYSKAVISKTLEKLIPLAKKSSILDIGCGSGQFINQLHQLQFTQVTGIDFSNKMVEIAKKNNPNTPIFYVDAHHVDTLKQTFKVITANMVLHDVEAVESVFTRLHACLKPGGILIFSIPHPCFFLKSSLPYFENQNPRLIVKQYRTHHSFQKKIAGKIRAIHYHRPLGVYVDSLKKAGFKLEALEEIFDDFNPKSIYHQIPFSILFTLKK